MNNQETVFLLRQWVAIAQKEAWYYVRVPSAQLAAFVKAMKNQDTSKKITDFGEVLYSGYDNPPAELQARMAEEYDLRPLEEALN